MSSAHYEEFEKRLEETDWEGKVKICLDGVMGNILTRHLQDIADRNLQTLEIMFPDAYEAIKDRKAREALVLAGLFEACPWKGRKEDLELAFPAQDRAAYTLRGLCSEEVTYRGEEALKVLTKSLITLVDEVQSVLDWPIQADPWRAKDKEQAEKLRPILESMLPKRTAGTFVYSLWYNYNQLKRARRRLSELLGIML